MAIGDRWMKGDVMMDNNPPLLLYLHCVLRKKVMLRIVFLHNMREVPTHGGRGWA